MPFSNLLERYIEFEWFLTWFPTTAASDLDVPQHRGNTYLFKSGDPSLVAGSPIRRMIGDGVGDEGDPLPKPNAAVVGYATLSLDSNGYFQANIDLHVGQVTRAKNVYLVQGGVTPFMINVRASDKDRALHHTAAVLQGVIATGPKPNVFEAVARAFGP